MLHSPRAAHPGQDLGSLALCMEGGAGLDQRRVGNERGTLFS